MAENTIGSLIRELEDNYVDQSVRSGKYVDFDMHETIEKIHAYLNSRHISGDTDDMGRDKPFFNIVTATGGLLHGVIVNSHTSGTLRFNDGASGTTSAGVKATGVLTASGVFSNGETITISERTYTMVTTLSGAANEVLIGVSAAVSLDNLKSAINASAGAGTTYGTGTVAHLYIVTTLE